MALEFIMIVSRYVPVGSVLYGVIVNCAVAFIATELEVSPDTTTNPVLLEMLLITRVAPIPLF